MDDRTRPSLAGARLRVSRGIEHANAMVDLVTGSASESGSFYVKVDAAQYALPGGVDVELDWSEWRHPPTSELSLLASESVFNLRAALDYVAYELAWLDSGQRQEDTQFPIVDDPKDWSKQESRRLLGISNDHRSAIREYQPFEGCEWIATLRRLSNLDKHRLLVAIRPELTGEFKLTSLPFAPDPGDASKLRAPMTNPRMDVVLPTNEPAVETLRAIGIGVGRVVEKFGPDFGEDVKLSVSQ